MLSVQLVKSSSKDLSQGCVRLPKNDKKSFKLKDLKIFSKTTGQSGSDYIRRSENKAVNRKIHRKDERWNLNSDLAISQLTKELRKEARLKKKPLEDHEMAAEGVLCIPGIQLR